MVNTDYLLFQGREVTERTGKCVGSMLTSHGKEGWIKKKERTLFVVVKNKTYAAALTCITVLISNPFLSQLFTYGRFVTALDVLPGR